MENQSTYEYQQDASDEVNDAGSKDCECNSDENYKTAPPLRVSDPGFAVSDSDDPSDSDLLTLRKRLISADENKDTVKSALDEIFVFLKSCNSDSHSKNQKHKIEIEIWEYAKNIPVNKVTKHTEEIMKLFLDSDIIWSLETKMRDFLLHRLIQYKREADDKYLSLIEMLLKSGKINVNARDDDGRTALHLADEEKVISLLIRYGADVNEKDNEGKTPLRYEGGLRVSILQTILKEARTSVDLDAIDCNGRTALMIAIIDNQPDAVDLLLNAGASVNVSDHLGFTALHHAIYTRFDNYDHFPRNLEELKKRKEIFTILFDANDERCDFNVRNQEWIAKKMEIVETLLGKQDIDVNALSFEQFSPLDIAEGCTTETPSSIKNALKEKGAILNVFRQTETQFSSDFQLVNRCNLALERFFCNICKKHDESQSTGGFQLDVRCRLALQRLLIEKILPVDLFERRLLTLIKTYKDQIVSSKDQQGRTALHLVAIFFSNIWLVGKWRFLGDNEKYSADDLRHTIVKELIAIGCNVNETDVFGSTPLHYADKIFKDSLNISHKVDASNKEKYGNSAIGLVEIPQRSSTNSSHRPTVKAVIDRNDETYILRLTNTNTKQMEIMVQSVDCQVRTHAGRKCRVNTVPRLLWGKGEYAFRHSLVNEITEEVIDLMDATAKEIERLDPRFAIKPELVGSSNEKTRLNKPDEFDFCVVLTKISELCEVSQSPELPTGFVRLKRKPTILDETSDFARFFGKDGILCTEKLNWQFTTILYNALVNIESQQSFKSNLEFPIRKMFDAGEKTSSIQLMKPLNFRFGDYISIDIVPCIHVDGWWPDGAIANVSDEIKTFGCNLIFDRPQKHYPWVPYSESCARISFSKAESDMIMASCANAREAYMIGKTMIEKSIARSQYTLKNCLLYCIEALTPTSEKASQLGLSLEELESKFHEMDRYLWLRCLMKCHLEFCSQDFCPCYFLPNFSSPIQHTDLKSYSPDSMIDGGFYVPSLCKEAYAFYRCTTKDTELCYQFQAPDPLWERFDRNELIARLVKIAYK